MFWLITLTVGCGGTHDLRQPNEPPTWPMENLVVDKTTTAKPETAAPAAPEPTQEVEPTSSPAPTEAPEDVTPREEAP